MIEVYKKTTDLYDDQIQGTVIRRTTQENQTTTRGNSKKLTSRKARREAWKYGFSHRVVKIWNALPDKVIMSGTIKSFEVNLDKYWENENLKYNREKVYDYEHREAFGRPSNT